MSKSWPARAALAAIVATTLSITAPAYAEEAPVNTLTIGPMDPNYNPMQTNAYRFTAKAGALQFKTTLTPGLIAHVMVLPADPQMAESADSPIVFSELFNSERSQATVNLPADGEYLLVLSRISVDGKQGHGEPLTLTGSGLQADSLYVPPIEIRNLENVQAVFQPLTVQVGILHGAPAQSLEVTVDGAEPTANLLSADGTPQPYTIDPASLDEGMHFLIADAKAPQGNNEGSAVRLFVVDRIDSFTDVPHSHWARTPIELLAETGVVNGRGGGKFEPDAPVTREEFAKMFALANGLEAPDKGGVDFKDIPADAWSRPHVQALAAAGLIKGEQVGGADYFRPQRLITRAEAATIIGRSMGVSETVVAEGDAPFTDFAAVPDYARASVKALAQAKLLNGFEDGSFRPDGLLTRAQAAKLLTSGF